ncbi:hypothetical protein PHOSAC3_150370 [Mesotoga infera]|nr:hypothetical protein PHOSAC3_150370 [Mesotoga infera]
MICQEMHGSFVQTGIMNIPIPSRRIRTMAVVLSWCFVVAVGLTPRTPFESLFGAETRVLSDIIIWVFGFAGQPSEFALLKIFELRIAEASKPRVEAGETCSPLLWRSNIKLDLSDKFARCFMTESKRKPEVDTGQILKLSYK